MKPEKVRAESLATASSLGYEVLPSLPLFENAVCIRNKEAVLTRTLTLYAVIACSYGLEQQKALTWLEHEGYTEYLTSREQNFLTESVDVIGYNFMYQVESLWALAWGLSLVDALNFSRECDDNFVELLPNLHSLQSSREFRSRVILRSVDEVMAKCDLAYCLHWSVRQNMLDNKILPGTVPPYVVIERRRALEWLLADEEWDDISLDT